MVKEGIFIEEEVKKICKDVKVYVKESCDKVWKVVNVLIKKCIKDLKLVFG